MELVLLIATVLNLISVVLNVYSCARYKELISEIIKDQSYPEYYKDVLIYYQLPSDSEEQVEKAWLAVNDDNEYLWTISETYRVISDKFVNRWEYIK
jgi:hypothetical protein